MYYNISLAFFVLGTAAEIYFVIQIVKSFRLISFWLLLSSDIIELDKQKKEKVTACNFLVMPLLQTCCIYL